MFENKLIFSVVVVVIHLCEYLRNFKLVERIFRPFGVISDVAHFDGVGQLMTCKDKKYDCI